MVHHPAEHRQPARAQANVQNRVVWWVGGRCVARGRRERDVGYAACLAVSCEGGQHVLRRASGVGVGSLRGVGAWVSNGPRRAACCPASTAAWMGAQPRLSARRTDAPSRSSMVAKGSCPYPAADRGGLSPEGHRRAGLPREVGWEDAAFAHATCSGPSPRRFWPSMLAPVHSRTRACEPAARAPLSSTHGGILAMSISATLRRRARAADGRY